MQKFVKPSVPQKPKVYLKISDLGNLPENENAIAIDLMAQCGAEHFLKSETELVKRLASNLAMVAFLKKQISMELVDVAPLIAKLISVEAILCRYLREARMTICTRAKESQEPDDESGSFPSDNSDLFEGMDD